jgi:SAM-dependent methyltransferase
MARKIAERFGAEWNIYREVIPLHREQFLGWIQPVPLSFFQGKRFLDAGCGIGRNSLWPLEAGAASGYAFDFDERTVAAAADNLRRFPECRVGFESIYDLDRRGEFDVVMCIGVVHHLEDPRRAMENLVRALKPGGTLILWVYAREGNRLYLAFVDPFRRWISSRLPPALTRAASRLLTVLLKIYLLWPWKDPYLKSLKKRSFRHIEAMVFDQLLPTIARYWTRDEVLSLVRGLPVRVKHLTHTHGMSWTLVAEAE